VLCCCAVMCCAGPAVSQRDDEDVMLLPPPRKRSVSDDYFLQEVSAPLPLVLPPSDRSRATSNLGQEEEKLVFESVLLSIWGSQGNYRQDRIKASSGAIKKVGSASNLQLHIDEYDLSSPKFDKKAAPVGGGEAAQDSAKVVPAVATEFMVRQQHNNIT
jgi:hypothetical protein